MPPIPDSEIERIKTEVSLVRLVEASGVALTKRGGDMVGCWPFHEDDTPSLVVTVTKLPPLSAAGDGELLEKVASYYTRKDGD